MSGVTLYGLVDPDGTPCLPGFHLPGIGGSGFYRLTPEGGETEFATPAPLDPDVVAETAVKTLPGLDKAVVERLVQKTFFAVTSAISEKKVTPTVNFRVADDQEEVALLSVDGVSLSIMRQPEFAREAN